MSDELSVQHLILEELRTLREEQTEQGKTFTKELIEQTQDLREELNTQTQEIRHTIAAVLNRMSEDKVRDESRFTELETHIYSLLGNGQPGRVGKLELGVSELKKTVNTWGGAIAVIGSIITIALAIIGLTAKHP